MNVFPASEPYVIFPPDTVDVAVVGHGDAFREELTAVRSRIPSLYADPLAWLVADAAESALTQCATEVLAAREDVAVILVSAHCTLHTMDAMARSLPAPRVSPLRFAGANPGSAGSLLCLLHGFKGSSLTLSMTPEDGLPAARTVARSWLRSGAASFVVLCTHRGHGEKGHSVRCAVLAPAAGRR
ncbi:coronafacic acid synthetase [Streptomyces longwoodensis]|uniref:coronafacic acid synthetase n=1 Tax=Streptomyces longwoodensis TaxID=68231 RepID=UPI0033A032BC